MPTPLWPRMRQASDVFFPHDIHVEQCLCVPCSLGTCCDVEIWIHRVTGLEGGQVAQLHMLSRLDGHQVSCLKCRHGSGFLC